MSFFLTFYFFIIHLILSDFLFIFDKFTYRKKLRKSRKKKKHIAKFYFTLYNEGYNYQKQKNLLLIKKYKEKIYGIIMEVRNNDYFNRRV